MTSDLVSIFPSLPEVEEDCSPPVVAPVVVSAVYHHPLITIGFSIHLV